MYIDHNSSRRPTKIVLIFYLFFQENTADISSRQMTHELPSLTFTKKKTKNNKTRPGVCKTLYLQLPDSNTA